MATDRLIEQLLASVIVKVYVPAARSVCNGVMVYGPTPPDGVITTDPVEAPLHNTFVMSEVAVIATGSVIVTGTMIVQLLASSTVKLYEPAARTVCAGVML